MALHAIRITEGQDLRLAIAKFVAREQLSACVVVSAVGSLSKATIRMAGAQNTDDAIREFDGPFEIVSLIGIPNDTMHLHIALSDSEGKVIGGHMKPGCIVHTTVELVLANEPALRFHREIDPKTGFDELQIEQLS